MTANYNNASEYEDEDFEDEYCPSMNESDEDEEAIQLMAIAVACKCGAYQVINGEVLHLADCVCGAE